MRKFPFLMDSIDWNMPINIHLFMYRRISVKRFIIIGKAARQVPEYRINQICD